MFYISLLLLPAHCQELSSAILTDPIEDPLNTLPAVLSQGITLPDGGGLPLCRKQTIPSLLTLSDAVDLALCNNTQVQIAWTNIKLQSNLLGQSRSSYFPTVSANINRINDTTKYPNSGIGSKTVIDTTLSGSINWKIYDFGNRQAMNESQKRLLNAAILTENSVIQKTIAQTVQEYYDALIAHAVLKAKQYNETVAGEIVEIAKRKEEKGRASNSEKFQALTALSKATMDKNRAIGSYKKAITVLEYFMGIPLDDSLELAEDIDINTSIERNEFTQNLQQSMLVALQNHPEISAATEKLESTKYDIKAVRSEGMPSISLFTNYYQNGRPGQKPDSISTESTTMGISVNIPIFDGFNRTYKIREAQSRYDQKEAEKNDITQQILLQVVKSNADFISAINNLDASAILVHNSLEALRASKRRYEKGAADIIEVLNAQAAFADAKQERIRCLAELYSSKLQLIASTGLINRQDIRKEFESK